MSRRGIVCEIKKEYCVFLTSDGQFVRGIPAGPNVQVGDEAEYLDYQRVKKPFQSKRLVVPLLSAAALFLLLFTTVLNPFNTVHAYVQVNGVESVEFGVDKDGHVVNMRQLSDTVEKKQTDSYKGKSVEQAIEDLLTSGKSEKEPVSITTVYTEKAGESNSKGTIQQAITNVKDKFAEKNVSVYEATEKQRKEANEKGQAIQKHLIQSKTHQKEKDKDKEHKPDRAEKGKETGKKEKAPKPDKQSDQKQKNDGEPKKPSGDKGEKNSSPSEKHPPKKQNNEEDKKIKNKDQKDQHQNNGNPHREKSHKEKEDPHTKKNGGNDNGQGKKNNGKNKNGREEHDQH